MHKVLAEAKIMLEMLPSITNISSVYELPYAFQNLDLLLTQYVYLSAIANYIETGGRSRGSYLIHDESGRLPHDGLDEDFRFSLDEGKFSNMIQETLYQNGICSFEWCEVRPIPQDDQWFENVWNTYLKGEIIVGD